MRDEDPAGSSRAAFVSLASDAGDPGAGAETPHALTHASALRDCAPRRDEREALLRSADRALTGGEREASTSAALSSGDRAGLTGNWWRLHHIVAELQPLEEAVRRCRRGSELRSTEDGDRAAEEPRQVVAPADQSATKGRFHPGHQ